MNQMAQFFHVPNIQGYAYAPGPQPNAPGVSHFPWDSWKESPVPWPNVVPSLNALANDPGTPRMRGGQPVINRIATLPADWLTIGGIVRKSQG